MPLSLLTTKAVDDFIANLDPYRSAIAGYSSAMSGTISFRLVEMLLEELARFHADIVDIKARAGILEYVRRRFGDATIDIITRLNALQAAVATTGTSIRTLMPTGTGGFVLAYTLSPDMTSTTQLNYRVVTAAQSATTKANLDAIVAAIDALIADLTT